MKFSVNYQDPYIHRPLPLVIGTPAFAQDDEVGLGDILSEGDEDGTEAASELSDESADFETESETESEADADRQPRKYDSEEVFFKSAISCTYC